LSDSVITEWQEVVDMLEGLGYKPIPENLEFNETSSKAFNKGYVLKHSEIDIADLTSNRNINCFQMILQVHYINQTNEARANNIVLIRDLVTELKDLDNFGGFINEPTIEDIEPKHLRVFVIFNYGIYTC
jgi:hypothetical protein